MTRDPVIVAVVTAFVFFIGLQLIGTMAPETVVATRLGDKLPEPLEKAIDLTVQTSQLLMTFAYGVLGAIAYLLTKSEDTAVYRSKREFYILVASAASAVTSILFGYFAISAVTFMLTIGIADMRASLVQLPSSLQYLAMVFSVVLLVGGMFARAERLGNEPPKVVDP